MDVDSDPESLSAMIATIVVPIVGLGLVEPHPFLGDENRGKMPLTALPAPEAPVKPGKNRGGHKSGGAQEGRRKALPVHTGH
jgi:hypothetical protein